ncbi:uncharacterized protein F4812DRAFT_466662 [Daldinia caldariorum]|uniref:uncharacterized protein n=1 Tax=Daldinia caldariorum TaxID=326644 RepID=UPI002008817B|nr:uncharacterized protein F4812DRAFT_466662 [Daldinia caldariorum]KAI1465220.1 hypothetical protein F4812DRAFT_466662 [Daldinia caldariorum]
MDGPDLSLPPKPPVPNPKLRPYNSWGMPPKPPVAPQLQQSTPCMPAVSHGYANPTQCSSSSPVFTPAAFALSSSPSASGQAPFCVPSPQGLPSPSRYPNRNDSALRNITPSPRIQTPTNGPVQQRRHMRKRDRRMLPDKSPGERLPEPRPTGKTPPWRKNKHLGPSPFQKPKRPRTPLEQPFMTRTEAILEGMGQDPIRRFFDLCLDKGVNMLNAEEQQLLSAYIDPQVEHQRTLVYRVAEQVLWWSRSHALTYKLLSWIQTRDQNTEITVRMLSERLSMLEPEDDKKIMSLEELDELMNCQIALDMCKKELQKKGDKKPESP